MCDNFKVNNFELLHFNITITKNKNNVFKKGLKVEMNYYYFQIYNDLTIS